MSEPRIVAERVYVGPDGQEWLIQIPDDVGVPLTADARPLDCHCRVCAANARRLHRECGFPLPDWAAQNA